MSSIPLPRSHGRLEYHAGKHLTLSCSWRVAYAAGEKGKMSMVVDGEEGNDTMKLGKALPFSVQTILIVFVILPHWVAVYIWWKRGQREEQYKQDFF